MPISLFIKKNAIEMKVAKRVEAIIREVNKLGEIVLEIDYELKSFSNLEIKMIME